MQNVCMTSLAVVNTPLPPMDFLVLVQSYGLKIFELHPSHLPPQKLTYPQKHLWSRLSLSNQTENLTLALTIYLRYQNFGGDG